MITSVFRFAKGQRADVDSSLIDDNLPLASRGVLLDRLAAEVRAEADDDPGSFLWIKLADPLPEELALVAGLFDLPTLQVEDAANPKQRAKIEVADGRALVVLKELRYENERKAVETGQMSVFVGPGYAVSVRHGDAAPGSARARLARDPHLAAHGSVAVLYAIADVLVDGYLHVIEEIGVEIENVEEAVFSTSDVDHAGAIYNLKRENLELKRAVTPMVAAGRTLAQETHPAVPAPMRPYFRDIGDHLLRAADMAESNDQLLMTMLMAATSQQDLRQNRDMRKISAWAGIVAVPTAIAGIYGMNFDNMPELHSEWGYPTVLGLMAGVCGFLYWRFKKSGWL